MSTMVYFDTLRYVKTLEAAGFSARQAEAFVKVQQDSLSESLDTTLATKGDIQGLKVDIHDIKAEIRLIRWMLGVLIAGMGALIMKLFFA